MSYVRKNLDAYSKERAGRSRLYLLISIKDQVMYLQLCITKRRCKNVYDSGDSKIAETRQKGKTEEERRKLNNERQGTDKN